MLYLIDTDALIDAKRDYYPLDRVPQFWEWLLNMGGNGSLKVPLENYEEVTDGNDDLADWIKANREVMVLNESSESGLLTRVLERYAPDLMDWEIEGLKADPFLIAYALADSPNRCVVTTEASKPSTIRTNRRIPDVCNDLDIRCINTFQLIRDLDFRIR